jgi:hypothetical protein
MGGSHLKNRIKASWQQLGVLADSDLERIKRITGHHGCWQGVPYDDSGEEERVFVTFDMAERLEIS